MIGSGPCARSGHTLTACGGKFYLFGGTGRLDGEASLIMMLASMGSPFATNNSHLHHCCVVITLHRQSASPQRSA